MKNRKKINKFEDTNNFLFIVVVAVVMYNKCHKRYARK